MSGLRSYESYENKPNSDSGGRGFESRQPYHLQPADYDKNGSFAHGSGAFFVLSDGFLLVPFIFRFFLFFCLFRLFEGVYFF